MVEPTTSFRGTAPPASECAAEPWSDIVGLVRHELGEREAQVLTWVYLEGRTSCDAAAMAVVEVHEVRTILSRIYHYLAVHVLPRAEA